MSDADVHRSTPGYVYGIGVRSSRQEAGPPPCSCPCHRAETPRGANGWYCGSCYARILICSYPAAGPVAYSHEQAIADGTANPRPYMVSVPDYYFITKGNTLSDELEEHFATKEEAQARATDLNREDVVASLDLKPKQLRRVQRFGALVSNDSHWTHDSKWWWVREHGKYALYIYDGDGSCYWTSEETLAEVREAVERGDVEKIVDLDNGKAVPFKRTVSVRVG